MTNHCTGKLVSIISANDSTTPLSISKLGELYSKHHGDGLWKIAPKQSLVAFLSWYPEIFQVDGEKVTLNSTHGEFECLSRLEQILIELTTNGPVNTSLLGRRYTQRFKTKYWKKSSCKSLPAFLAEHPDMFLIDGDNVEMVSTYATTRCVARLAQLLRAWKGPNKVDISTLESWYSRNFGSGYWRQLPGKTLKSFLARHSNDFVVDGKEVTLRITEAQCIANLRKFLESASGKKMMSSELASLYIAKYKNRDWKTLGKRFKTFLKEHPNDFLFNKRCYVTLVAQKFKASHNDTNSSKFNDPIPDLAHQVDEADGNGDSVSLDGSLRTSTTESSSTRKASFWDESEESTWTTYSVADDLLTTSPSTILPTAAKPKPAPTAFSHLHPPAPESRDWRPASPTVSVVNFRIADIPMPKPDNRAHPWRTTVSSEMSECDDADADADAMGASLLTFSDLTPEPPFLEHARPPLVPSSDSHGASGVRAAGPSKDRHHLALDASWGLDAERHGAAIGIGIGNGMEKRRSELHKRLKQSDPASHVGILEGLLELERRRNELERRRNRDGRDRIAQLEHLVVEREQEIEELRDRIHRMEEVMVLEGSMRGLRLNVY